MSVGGRHAERVCVVMTGGTIGMVRDGSGVLRPGGGPEAVLALVPEVVEVARIEVVALLDEDSANLTPAHWTQVAETVGRALDPDDDTWGQRDDPFDGVVVVHGTDTMAHTASAVAFALGPSLDVPVVFTGSQVDASVPHGDARTNLLRAVTVACADLAGVLICFGDQVHLGVRAQKVDSRRFAAFASPAHPPVADIAEQVLLHPSAPRRGTTPRRAPLDVRADFAATILQVVVAPGLRPALLDAVLDSGACEAVVLQCHGSGTLPDAGEHSLLPLVRRAVAAHVPVVLTSQIAATSTTASPYATGRRAIDAGAVPTGNMTGPATTTKLHWALASHRRAVAAGTSTRSERIASIAHHMTTPYVGEMDAPPT